MEGWAQSRPIILKCTADNADVTDQVLFRNPLARRLSAPIRVIRGRPYFPSPRSQSLAVVVGCTWERTPDSKLSFVRQALGRSQVQLRNEGNGTTPVRLTQGRLWSSLQRSVAKKMSGNYIFLSTIRRRSAVLGKIGRPSIQHA